MLRGRKKDEKCEDEGLVVASVDEEDKWWRGRRRDKREVCDKQEEYEEERDELSCSVLFKREFLALLRMVFVITYI